MVLNGQHGAVKNGNNLLGSSSSTNNAIIVPMPDNDTLYYIFTIGAIGQVNSGLRYSIINKKGDNGNGEVIEKNTLLLPNCFEKLAITHHCNGSNFWIVTHEWNSNKYFSFELTKSGINTTPIISIGAITIDVNDNNAIGSLKFSVDGKKIAAAHSYAINNIELSNFNNSTGQLSNSILFRTTPVGSPNAYTGVYALEFSPNGKNLYVSENAESDGAGKLYQFDVSIHNAIDIYNSVKLLSITNGGFSGGLQLASDGKIYHCIAATNYLGCVKNPDIYGLGCNYESQNIFLEPSAASKVRFGLPSLVKSFYDPTLVFYSFSVNNRNCSDKTISFTLNTTVGIDSVKWDFGDFLGKSTIANPVYTYNTDGIFTATLTVFSTRCGSVKKNIVNKQILIKTNQDILGADKYYCDFTKENLKPTIVFPNTSFLWNTGEKTESISATSLGKYWLQIEFNNCLSSDTIELFSKVKSVMRIIGEDKVCKSNPILLKTSINNATDYLWSTGESTSSIKIDKPGFYKVIATSDCVYEDSILVTNGDCDFFMSNTFTPNNDGKNDLFGPVNEFYSTNYKFVVFDRWSKPIFNSTNISHKWDGTKNGKALPNGSYIWMIQYINKRGLTKYEQGMVTLIR